ncbi:MAG: nucleotidyltransferase family protein [Bacteroidia bacterium]|nr:nucleotidyltransferase family protein [Bacteroidia bacterium]
MKISAIILAAGSSSRLGRAKQLLKYKNKSFIQQLIDKLEKAGISKPITVLGARFEKISQHIKDTQINTRIVENPKWKEGMSSSLIAGINSLEKEVDGVLICLSDQPLIPLSHYQQLLDSFKENQKLITSLYQKSVGVPAVIPQIYFQEILQLEGKAGAKYILKKYQKESILIPCEEAGWDVDTDEDYRRIVDAN